MSARDPLDGAFASWRAATDDATPPPLLLERIARATAAPPTLLGPLVRLGRHALVGAALAAALLTFAAVRSVRALEDEAAAAIVELGP